jgi:Lar family restriction alleviation protein
MDKLKVCPFCGSEAIIEEDKKGLICVVSCNTCCAEGQVCQTKDEAIRMWNTRPIEDKLVEALKEMIYEFNRSFPANTPKQKCCDKAKQTLKSIGE